MGRHPQSVRPGDAGHDAPPSDQRGQPRPETGDSMCNVGAFEVQP
jgi:hypothetical protein